jgi:hypothetical protein
MNETQLIAEHHIDPGIPNGGALSPDGKTVAVAGTDNMLRIYDLTNVK